MEGAMIFARQADRLAGRRSCLFDVAEATLIENRPSPFQCRVWKGRVHNVKWGRLDDKIRLNHENRF